MRNYNSIFQVQNALTGVLCASTNTAATTLGNAIDTINFQDMIAILSIGTLKGSDAADTGADVTVKIQECATINGTFTDITAGAINGTAVIAGSAKFDTVSVLAGSAVSATPFYQRKLYVLLNTADRQRYVRPHASITGTASSIMQVACSVSALLGRARESGYISDAVSNGTTDAFVTYGFAQGSVPGM